VTPTADSIQEAVKQLREAERLLLDALAHLGAADDLLTDSKGGLGTLFEEGGE